MHRDTIVTIMAGGIGSRFWPLSREQYPKQFLDLLGTGRSMLQMTFDRFEKGFGAEKIFVVTSDMYKQEVLAQLPALKPEQVFTEPSRKNTAPCILYSALKLQQQFGAVNMIVTPADHFILEQEDFLSTINQGLHFLEQNPESLITLGIQPTKPHTGYGYIQYEETPRRVKKVKLFTEKPSLEYAEQFLASGDFLWNSGIFLWCSDTIKACFQSHLLDVYELFNDIAYNTEQEVEQINKAYSHCQNISIDYGILEKSSNVYVLPSYFSWSDLGTWDALYDLRSNSAQDNVSNSELVQSRNSGQSIIHTSNDKKLIVLQDVDNLIVVDTDDVLIICNKDSEQKIKEVVHSIQAKDLTDFL